MGVMSAYLHASMIPLGGSVLVDWSLAFSARRVRRIDMRPSYHLS
jgi:hypothetical protein